MGMLQEFKEFAIKGNVVDMAVGVIIGAAFGKIVASAIEDIVMPPLGMLLGGVDFADLAIQLKAAVGDTFLRVENVIGCNLFPRGLGQHTFEQTSNSRLMLLQQPETLLDALRSALLVHHRPPCG